MKKTMVEIQVETMCYDIQLILYFRIQNECKLQSFLPEHENTAASEINVTNLK